VIEERWAPIKANDSDLYGPKWHRSVQGVVTFAIGIFASPPSPCAPNSMFPLCYIRLLFAFRPPLPFLSLLCLSYSLSYVLTPSLSFSFF